MTDTRDTGLDRNDRPPDDPKRTDDAEPNIIFEVAVPTDAFALENALGAFPDVIVEFERLVPTVDRVLPYLWTTDGKTPAFRDAMADDPQVDRVHQVSAFDDGALYEVDWTLTDGGLLHWFATTDGDAALVQTDGHDDEWLLKVRFPARAQLTEFRDFLTEQDIDYRVVRLYDLTDPKLGQYNMTEKQREALITALELGYFEIPRDAILEDVADALDISPKSASERLRRGQTNLVSNTLTIGQPTGLGLPEK